MNNKQKYSQNKMEEARNIFETIKYCNDILNCPEIFSVEDQVKACVARQQLIKERCKLRTDLVDWLLKFDEGSKY